jgi:uncharacterized coiled-coil protein SlyX
MGRKEKIKEMERRAEEMEESTHVKSREFDALSDKLADNIDEYKKLADRLSELVRKMEQRSTYGWWSPSTSTIQQQQQEKVALQKEEAVLKAEIAANKKEREELKAACHAKVEELEELSTDQKLLLNTAQLYLLPN